MSQVSLDFDRSSLFPDRRLHHRQLVHSLAYVELGEGNGGIVLNISEGGMAFQAVMSLPSDELPLLRVQLAHSKKAIEVKGRIVWTNESRKLAGVQFVDLSEESLKLIREWISLESPAGATSESPDGSTIFPAESEAMPPTAANTATTAAVVPPIAKSRTLEATSASKTERVRTSVEFPVRFEFNPLIQKHGKEGASAKGRFAGWIGALTLASFALGWLAGHGSPRREFEELGSKILSEKISAENASKQMLLPAVDTSNIEVVNLKNQRRLVPMRGQRRSPSDAANKAGDSLPPSDSLTSGGGALSRETNSNLPSERATVYKGRGFQAGKLLRRVEPIYPADALRQRIEGSVKLFAMMDEEGNVKTVRVLGGPSILIPAAVSAVSQWRYSPTLVDGQPIESERQVTVTFKLTKTQMR